MQHKIVLNERQLKTPFLLISCELSKKYLPNSAIFIGKKSIFDKKTNMSLEIMNKYVANL